MEEKARRAEQRLWLRRIARELYADPMDARACALLTSPTADRFARRWTVGAG